MIDNLLYQLEKLENTGRGAFESAALKARLGRYGVVTLHRPSNVDSRESLENVAEALRAISTKLPLVFPVHPRTRANLDNFGVSLGEGVVLTRPLSYMEFLNLWKDAEVVLTDSGGLQEETTALGVPCITIRENTERPVTVEEGTNVLAGTNPRRIVEEAEKVLRGEDKRGCRPHLWDGNAARRIVEILAKALQ
jgi:UDP-N-acetylglucosamine 2-epimerase (non-hydrolysing)